MFGKQDTPVIIVSGLPRSGTSMMMRMLERGGLSVLQDGIREPNADNPKGYYEFERVKKLPQGDVAWLPEAQGKVVKVIAALLVHLPDTHTYKVLFMRRKMEEILASQRRMLVRRGEDPDAVDDAEMARLFEKHLAQVYAWMAQQANLSYLDVDYNAALADPLPAAKAVRAFLGLPLDEIAMASVVDPTLYRQRK
ncbi:MAG: sulfotransferase family protein [Anaerolineae bacterium]|nr:sulfotransferase family protein [Anaerolineae bacterium]